MPLLACYRLLIYPTKRLPQPADVSLGGRKVLPRGLKRRYRISLCQKGFLSTGLSGGESGEEFIYHFSQTQFLFCGGILRRHSVVHRSVCQSVYRLPPRLAHAHFLPTPPRWRLVRRGLLLVS